MPTHAIRSIEIYAPFGEAFKFIADPSNLPKWAHAFETASDGKARLRTPDAVARRFTSDARWECCCASIASIASHTSSARKKAIIDFTARICGIADPENACRCAGRMPYAIKRGRVQLGRPLFGESIRETAARFGGIEETVRSLKRLRRAAALFRTHPRFTVGHDLAPGEVARRR